MDIPTLLIFIPTMFLISITPGLCMILSLSMGISIGFRKTINMMYGELLGVFIIVLLCSIGIATIMTKYPFLLVALKYLGGSYLIYVGISMWREKGNMTFSSETNYNNTSILKLSTKGFITAIANPKGWAFFISALPPFINQSLPLAPQLSLMMIIILFIEFICLIIYAMSGHILKKQLEKSSNVRLLNKISGSLIISIGIWLALF